MREVVLLFGINAIMVVGYQVFVGSTGIVSFGHVAFMAVGAYAGGIAAIPVDDKVLYLPELPGFLADIELAILPALVLGGAAAALLALVTGFALMRLSGEAAAIAMLGLTGHRQQRAEPGWLDYAGTSGAVRRARVDELLLGLCHA